MALSTFCVVKILNQNCYSICRKSIQCFILLGWKLYDQREIIVLSAKYVLLQKKKKKKNRNLAFNQR